MNKIFALWCHPRSMSTTMERVMRERGDLACLHEPFMYDYYLNPERDDNRRGMPFFEPKPDHPQRYDGIRDLILETSEAGPVFFKDMSYYMTSYLEGEFAFYQRLDNCFLIRNPKATIASYYQMDNEVSLDEIGLEAQWNHLEWLEGAGIGSYILQAEEVQQNPREEISRWWKWCGLVNKPEAFTWNRKPPEDWLQVEAWHASTLTTTGIRQRMQEDVEKETERFEQSAREAPHLLEFLDYHQPFYEKLKSRAIVLSNR